MSRGEILPLIAFVNSKSGGQDGPKLIKKLQEHIPKDNVFDLSEGGPAVGLAKCKNQRMRVLVCGGDGTVAWVLSEIKKQDFEERVRPVVAILPLGTANDLSRTLKWGPGWAGEKLLPLISQIDKASVVHMDQWHVTISTTNNEAQDKSFVMNNYFSVGSDAEVALKFHKKREEKPNLFKNRTRNKGYYAKFAVGTFLRAQPLSTGMEVELDGTKLDLPSNLSVFLILNTPSYASGMNPWGDSRKKSKKENFTHQTIDDGKFEVVGIKGLLHAGGLQMRVVKGKRLGQGSTLTIRLNRPIAAQVDGEPWLQEPTVIKISHAGHAMMLANSPPTNHGPLPEKAEQQAPSVAVLSLSLEGAEALSKPKVVPPVTRTMSSNTLSNVQYGPVPPTKRKKNRYYCDVCDFEFFLPYMLDNHKAKGCSKSLTGSSSSLYTSSTPPLFSPSSLACSSSAPALMDSSSSIPPPTSSQSPSPSQSQDEDDNHEHEHEHEHGHEHGHGHGHGHGHHNTDAEYPSESKEAPSSGEDDDEGVGEEDVVVVTDPATLFDGEETGQLQQENAKEEEEGTKEEREDIEKGVLVESPHSNQSPTTEHTSPDRINSTTEHRTAPQVIDEEGKTEGEGGLIHPDTNMIQPKDNGDVYQQNAPSISSVVDVNSTEQSEGSEGGGVEQKKKQNDQDNAEPTSLQLADYNEDGNAPQKHARYKQHNNTSFSTTDERMMN